MKKALVTLIVLYSIILSAQQERFYTQGSYNGYAWNNMFIDSKLNFLSSMLDKWKYSDQPFNGATDSNCVSILKKILSGKIRINSSLRDMVGYLNSFYSENENLEIPVVSSYCTIVENIFDFGIPYRKETTDSLRVLFKKPDN